MENRTTAACGPVSLPRVDAPPRPPLCSGRARTTAGDLPPPLGALCPRKGYPSGKDERLASHPGELRRLSAVCMRPQFSTWVLGGSPTRA